MHVPDLMKKRGKVKQSKYLMKVAVNCNAKRIEAETGSNTCPWQASWLTSYRTTSGLSVCLSVRTICQHFSQSIHNYSIRNTLKWVAMENALQKLWAHSKVLYIFLWLPLMTLIDTISVPWTVIYGLTQCFQPTKLSYTLKRPLNISLLLMSRCMYSHVHNIT
jgi:hypothetical protein